MAITDIGSVEVKCGACGSKTMVYEEGMEESSKVHCADCSAFIGTIGGLRSAAIATAKSAIPDIAKALGKAFKF